MKTCAWTHDGAKAFSMACADLNLHGASIEKVEEISRALPMLTFYADKIPMGAAIFSEGTVHIAILKEWRKRWMNKNILAAFKDALSLFANKALIAPENETSRYFAHKLGWKKTGMEDDYVRYQP